MNIRNNKWILIYRPENNPDWIEKEFEESNDIFLKRTFSLKKEDLFLDEISTPTDEDEIFEEKSYQFLFSESLEGDYYKIRKGILINDHNIYFHKDVEVEPNHFVSYQNISIFRNISSLVQEDIIIGGERKNAIPFNEFQTLLSQFPNTYELKRYAQARISTVLRNYLETTVDATKKYQSYMNKKVSNRGTELFRNLKQAEIVKYQSILSKLQEMLKDEDNYNEDED